MAAMQVSREVVGLEVVILCAVDAEGGYKKDGKVPWYLPEEWDNYMETISSSSSAPSACHSASVRSTSKAAKSTGGINGSDCTNTTATTTNTITRNTQSMLIGRTTWENDWAGPGLLCWPLLKSFANVAVLSHTQPVGEDTILHHHHVTDADADDTGDYHNNRSSRGVQSTYVRVYRDVLSAITELVSTLQGERDDEIGKKDDRCGREANKGVPESSEELRNEQGLLLHHRLFIMGGADVFKEALESGVVDLALVARVANVHGCQPDDKLCWLDKLLMQQMKQVSMFLHEKGTFKVERWERLRTFPFTCESVTIGHPDKLCDLISDVIVDAFLEQDCLARVSCETMVHNDYVALAGYVESAATVNIEERVRGVLKEVGFDDLSKGLNYRTAQIVNRLEMKKPSDRGSSRRSSSSGGGGGGDDDDVMEAYLSTVPADDQGSVFGYASDEDSSFLPLPLGLARGLTQRLTELCQSCSSILRPVGKAQVTVEYKEMANQAPRPISVLAVVLEAQHEPDVMTLQQIRHWLEYEVVRQCIPSHLLTDRTKLYLNGAGKYIHGGFNGGGLTGRKLAVDTYGGWVGHGGGAFSGKDWRKMDRSAAYAARKVAVSLVASGLCQSATVQLSFAIGFDRPVSLRIDTRRCGDDLVSGGRRNSTTNGTFGTVSNEDDRDDGSRSGGGEKHGANTCASGGGLSGSDSGDGGGASYPTHCSRVQISDSVLEKLILSSWDLSVKSIIQDMQLWRPLYSMSTRVGHFGSAALQNGLPWEKPRDLSYLLVLGDKHQQDDRKSRSKLGILSHL